jgi:hypothetical protein
MTIVDKAFIILVNRKPFKITENLTFAHQLKSKLKNGYIHQAFSIFIELIITYNTSELGHFIPAKLFKTRVEKFYLFFDVKYSLIKENRRN